MRACKLAPVALVTCFAAVAAAGVHAQDVEWRSYGSDVAGTKYSPLDQINRETIDALRIVWRQSVLPDAVRQGRNIEPPVGAQNTPLMADGRLYISTAIGTAAALDAASGALLWFDRPPDRDGQAFRRARQTRGVAYWADPRGGAARVVAVVGPYLVALDARTGERIWHFQAVHHGLWDYDFPAAPNVVDLWIEGRSTPVKAVAAVSKQAFTYVFDRVTGKPIWPIEERSVPAGDVPGEWYAATQPFPTKPPPFDQQGTTADDLIDFTPELRQDALEVFRQYVSGPLFTPPSLVDDRPGGTRGTLQMPGVVGGADWGGAAVDPETGILYVPSVHHETVIGIVPSEHPRSDMRLVVEALEPVAGPNNLPLFKPPYGRLVAIDLNRGDILWSTANGDGPSDHPVLRHLDLPPLGQPGRVSPLVTKSFVFLGEGGNAGVVAMQPLWGGAGGKQFRAYDKLTGDVVWEMALPGGTTAAPMTYLLDGKQYIVVTVGWEDMPSEYIALALP